MSSRLSCKPFCFAFTRSDTVASPEALVCMVLMGVCNFFGISLILTVHYLPLWPVLLHDPLWSRRCCVLCAAVMAILCVCFIHRAQMIKYMGAAQVSFKGCGW